jgi:hypothetical protein
MTIFYIGIDEIPDENIFPNLTKKYKPMLPRPYAVLD